MAPELDFSRVVDNYIEKLLARLNAAPAVFPTAQGTGRRTVDTPARLVPPPAR